MGDNPKWQPILDKLPESLHPMIKPVLMEWDQGVQQMLKERDDKFAPYKDLAEKNIDPRYIDQALQVAELIRDDPKLVVERINEANDLGFVPQGQVANQSQPDDDDDLEEYDEVDIENHPKFKALLEQVDSINKGLTAQQQKDQDAAEEQEFQEYLKTLHTDHGEFDDQIVMAYMAYGDMEGPDAVEKYRELIASHIQAPSNQQQQGQEQDANGVTSPPVVLDGSPAGSGSEQQPIDFGKMTKRDTNKFVADMLEAAANENN